MGSIRGLVHVIISCRIEMWSPLIRGISGAIGGIKWGIGWVGWGLAFKVGSTDRVVVTRD